MSTIVSFSTRRALHLTGSSSRPPSPPMGPSQISPAIRLGGVVNVNYDGELHSLPPESGDEVKTIFTNFRVSDTMANKRLEQFDRRCHQYADRCNDHTTGAAIDVQVVNDRSADVLGNAQGTSDDTQDLNNASHLLRQHVEQPCHRYFVAMLQAEPRELENKTNESLRSIVAFSVGAVAMQMLDEKVCEVQGVIVIVEILLESHCHCLRVGEFCERDGQREKYFAISTKALVEVQERFRELAVVSDHAQRPHSVPVMEVLGFWAAWRRWFFRGQRSRGNQQM